MFVYLVIFLILLIVCTLVQWTYAFVTYWQRRGFPSIRPLPLFGNCFSVFTMRESNFERIQALYNEGHEHGAVGVYYFRTPILMLRDAELIKHVTITHFDHFVNHSGVFFDLSAHPMTETNLFSQKDEEWRFMRQRLTKSFTGANMRQIFPELQQCAHQFTTYFPAHARETIEVHVLDIASRYSNDTFMTTALGVHINSFRDRNNPFYLAGNGATQTSLWRSAIGQIAPELAHAMGVHFVSQRSVNRLMKLFGMVVDERKKSGVRRGDILQMLLDAQEESVKSLESNVPRIDLKTIFGELFVFFFGGYDTLSSLITFALLELAVNPHVQARLHQTIIESPTEPTYELIQDMKYLDMVIAETLRKWPADFSVDRVCSKDIDLTIRGETRRVRAGEILSIPIYALHRDPRYFPEPHVFDPERFNAANKSQIVSGSYVPFGSGPRQCIASRISVLEAKLFVYHVVKEWELVPTRNTQVPLTTSRVTVFDMPACDLIGFRRR